MFLNGNTTCAGQRIPKPARAARRLLKVIIKRHQTGAEDQAQRPVLQQTALTCSTFLTPRQSDKNRSSRPAFSNNQRNQRHQQVHVQECGKSTDFTDEPQPAKHDGDI